MRHTSVFVPPLIRTKSAYPIALSAIYSFQLYENCRSLHECTRAQKKEAVLGEESGFDGEAGEPNNFQFQTPQLSSLAKLVSVFFSLLLTSSDGCYDQNMDDILRL